MTAVFAAAAQDKFVGLSKTVQKKIQKALKFLQKQQDPWTTGEVLVGHLLGFRRYCVDDDCRILFRIRDGELVVVDVDVGRREI